MSTPNNQPLIQNPFNQLLAQKHANLQNAQRFALGTVCDPAGQPQVTGLQLRRQIRTIQINASTVGDNVIIPNFSGRKLIYEVVLWNSASAQNLLWQQGVSGNNPIPLLPLPAFPAGIGFFMGFNGNFDMPHWEIDNNQPLVLNLSAGGLVTGFIRYRIDNGTN